MIGERVLARFYGEFPHVSEVVGTEKLRSGLDQWSRQIQDPRFLDERRGKRSRGFWNDALAQIDHRMGSAGSRRRFQTIEAGLKSLQTNNGSTRRWARELTTDDAGYSHHVAELFVLASCGKLGRLAFEQQGHKPGKDYDVTVHDGGNSILHVEVKHRSAPVFGRVDSRIDRRLAEALRPGLDEYHDTYVSLRRNQMSEPQFERTVDTAKACIRAYRSLDDLRRYPLRQSDPEALDFPPNLREPARRAVWQRKRAEIVHHEDRVFVALEEESSIFADDDVVEGVSFFDGSGEVHTWGVAERLAPYSPPSLDSLGVTTLHDKKAECGSIRQLASSVPDQLPTRGPNILALVVDDEHQLADIELALLGEPFLNGGRMETRGGLFDDPSWTRVTGVAAILLPLSTYPAKQVQIHWHPNSAASTPLDHVVLGHLNDAVLATGEACMAVAEASSVPQKSGSGWCIER